ncbi:MAG: hypothetical protein ACJAV1_003542 [Paraglaciecola sp.]|jgi:hypothetical protein
MEHQILKSKQRLLRDRFSENLSLRVHRTLSWFDKSEQCGEDKDSQFVFLWIAFYAASAQDTECLQLTEAKAFSLFISKLVELDQDNKLYGLLWCEYTSSVRVLLDNKFVFQPFGDYHNEKTTEEEWKERFSKAKAPANYALANKHSEQLITLVLQRMYTLRNQIVHGGATWDSSANRTQIRNLVVFLSRLVLFVIDIMMDNPEQVWGDANYPVINNKRILASCMN